MRHGDGVMTFADGSTYVGGWMSGLIRHLLFSMVQCNTYLDIGLHLQTFIQTFVITFTHLVISDNYTSITNLQKANILIVSIAKCEGIYLTTVLSA